KHGYKPGDAGNYCYSARSNLKITSPRRYTSRFSPIRIDIGIGIVVRVAVSIEAVNIPRRNPHRIDHQEPPYLRVIPARTEVINPERTFFLLAGKPDFVVRTRCGIRRALTVRFVRLAPDHLALLIGRGHGRAEGIIVDVSDFFTRTRK